MTPLGTHRSRHARLPFALAAALLLAVLSFRQTGMTRAKTAVSSADPAARSTESEERREPTLPPTERVASRAVFGFVRATSGAPIAAAAVCVFEQPALGATRRCTASDRSGRFRLEDVRPGEIMLNAHARGFVAQTRTLPAAANDGAPLTFALRPGGATLTGTVSDALGGPIAGAFVVARDEANRIITVLETARDGAFEVEVEPGALTLEANAEAYSRHTLSVIAPASAVAIVLTPASALSGRVEANGVPVEGARVVAGPADGPMIGARETSSDANGAFKLTELPAGNYQLTATRADRRSKPVWVELVVGQPGESTTLSLEPAASLLASVHVRGEPCRAGRVNLNGAEPRSEAVGEDGVASVDGVTPGRYELEVSCDGGAPRRESLELGAGVTKRDFELDAGRELRGRVEDASGRGVAGMWVTLEGAQPAAASASANTDARGDFTCTGLAPSEYDVSVRSTLGALGEKKHVDLTNVEVARVTLRLAGTAGIRVTLNGADGAHTPQVFAQPQDGMVVPAKRSGDELVFEHLPLGEYKVFTSGSAVPGDAGTLVALKYDGQVARITLPAPKLASIRGVVLDPEGNPVIDTWVRAASSNGLLGIYADTPNAAITDDRGQFQLAGLIPGLYDLCTRCDTESQRVTGVEAGATGVVLRLSAAAPQDPRAAH